MTLIGRLFEQRVRGFRVIELASFAVLLMLVFGVYLAKAAASRERAHIAQIEQQIDDEQRRLRGLRAEVAHLEQPSRLEALSSAYLALQPVDPAHERLPDRSAAEVQPGQASGTLNSAAAARVAQ